MKKEKILSIVIPTYNIENYLRVCLKSFENNKLLDYVDIIIVNDGSTDNSSKIAKEFVNMYPDSYKLIDKENGGHGSTINRGLKEARGKYIMIVDGDDWINSKNLLEICRFLEENDSYDAVFYNYIMELKYKNKSETRTLKKIFNPGEINFNTASVSIYKQIGLANTIYKVSNLKKINLNLLEKTFYVDAEYMLYPMNTLKKAYYFDIPVYHYLIGRPTQSTNINTAIKKIDDRTRVINSIINYFNNKDSFNDFALKCYYTKTSSIVNDYYELLIKGIDNYSLKMKEFDKYLKEIDLNLYNSLSNYYFYIKLARKYNYNQKIIKLGYTINKIIIYFKRMG